MSEDPPPPEPAPAEVPAAPPEPTMQAVATAAVATAEAAATRRRWINLGEFVAVAGLLIGGVSLWLNWSERRSDIAEKHAERTIEAQQAARYEIAATVAKDGSLQFQRDEHHAIGDVTLAFPSALGIGTRTTPAQTVPKDWYDHALRKATDGGPDRQTGTLPVLATVHYWNGDTPMTARGVYDIVWKTEGGFVFGRSLHVVGFKRHERGGSQARIDALWASMHPAR